MRGAVAYDRGGDMKETCKPHRLIEIIAAQTRQHHRAKPPRAVYQFEVVKWSKGGLKWVFLDKIQTASTLEHAGCCVENGCLGQDE